MDELKAYLRRTGQSYRQLGKALGCDTSTAFYIAKGPEKGRRPSPALARKLHELTGIPLCRIRPDVWPPRSP